jgi:hypothetical protein
MPAGIQSRTQFLILAEFCQEVISSLLDYINGSSRLQANTLTKVLRALRSVQSGDPYSFAQRSAAAFSSYEQIRTLEEALSKQEIDEAVKLTKELLAGTGAGPRKRATAKKLMALFSRLRTKALWNFEQPKQTPPPDLRELCEALEIS